MSINRCLKCEKVYDTDYEVEGNDCCDSCMSCIEWVHVYPVNDLKKHDTESNYCDCEPEIDWKDNIVIHNAWDMREAQEFINTKQKE